MKVNKIIVVGCGTMGQGISQWFCQQGIDVEMVDNNLELVKEAYKKIEANFEKLLKNGKFSAEEIHSFKNHLSIKSIDQIDPNADLAIEAIYENFDAKIALFKTLQEVLKSEAIIASNTSSFSITKMASSLNEERKRNFIGIHFFNPATLMKLVEIISGIETSPEIAVKLVSWFNERKKIACLCSDSPGFIVNRVARNFYGEALRAVGHYDILKIEEVDKVLKEVGGFKMGPFELMDMIGIDVNFSVTESVYQSTFNEPRFKPHSLQRDMVYANRLGRKTKKGFYNYDNL